MLSQHSINKGHRQSDHIEEAAFYAGDPTGRNSLDCIGPGLVHWFTVIDVEIDFRFRNIGDKYFCDLCPNVANARSKQAHPRHDLVGTSGDESQHPLRIRGIAWLAKDVFIDHDDRIRTEHKRIGSVLPDFFGFLKCQTFAEGARRFAVAKIFWDV